MYVPEKCNEDGFLYAQTEKGIYKRKLCDKKPIKPDVKSEPDKAGYY